MLAKTHRIDRESANSLCCMTSASELFHQRRSRVGRDPSQEILDHSPTADHRNLYRRRLLRHDPDACDPRTHPRHLLLSSFVPPAEESPSNWHDQGANQVEPNNNAITGNSRNTSRPRSTDDRLPGTVLLARARLLERLSGMSLSETRPNARTSMGISNREYILRNRARDFENLRTENSVVWSSGGSPSLSRVQHRQGTVKIKPPGLSPANIDLLHSEVFSSFCNATDSEEVSHGLFDCSICLESFSEGDELIRLPCEHKFHFNCLEPWIRTCGDCPYCRMDIVASSHTIAKRADDPS